jgi:TolB-like protein/DNA-binding winged helix-turn-helix (wHTH) protein/Tfp pilus assembly protein PilF
MDTAEHKEHSPSSGMEESREKVRVLRFGGFALNLLRHGLYRNGERIHLTPKPFETLAFLVEQRGKTVEKQKLLDAVWRDAFVTEDTLVKAVREIRRVLGDNKDNPQFIQTVPGEGYRFVGQVTEERSNEPSGEESCVHGLAVSESDFRRRGTLRTRRWQILVALVFLALGTMIYVLMRRGPTDTTRLEIRSIAVIPLQNLSGDATQEYFADGMTEALISSLAQIRALRVISRTSAMSFKETKKPLPPLREIARELEVDAVIEGSVQRKNGLVKVMIQLIHVPTDSHLWARDYERTVTDVLKLQGEMARAIADEIRIQVTPEERARLASAATVNPAAHETYLLGRYHFWKLNEEDLKLAIGHFERAIQIEPRYAVAYADLSLAWQYRSFFGAATLRESESPARVAAQRALELDDSQAAAYFAAGHVKYLYDWNWTGAEKDYRRALELDPNNLDAHYYYSKLLQTVGRLPEAIQEIERARQLDPLSSMVESFFGQALYNARKYDEAVPHLERAIELEPRNFLAYRRLGRVYERMDRYDDALTIYEKAHKKGEPAYFVLRAGVYAKAGKQTKARQMLEEVAKTDPTGRRALGAAAFAAVGDKDEAFRLLMKQIDEHALPGLFFTKVDPVLDSLRSDRRWKEVLRRMNLPEDGN